MALLVCTSGGSPLGPGRQSRTAQAHDAMGLGEPLSSTRHMRQLPAIESRSWKQKRGISAPAVSHACSNVYSGGTSTSAVDNELRHALLRRDLYRIGVRVCRIDVDAPLDLSPEVPQQPLHRPGSAVADC